MGKDETEGQMFEVAIVGANFAGMQAALYLLRARRRVVLFDDGQHRNRFAAHSHGFLGQDGVAPAEIKARGLAELAAYPSLRVVPERVEVVSRRGEGFALAWAGGAAQAARVILATGQRDILPEVPGLAECWGKTANACPYCHGFELADLPTGILLGPEPHWAMYLRQIARWAGPLTVFDNGRGLAPEVLALVAERGDAHVAGPLEAFLHEDGKLSGVAVAGQVVPLRAFYLHSHSAPASGFAADLGCAMTEGPTGPFVTVDQWQRSSVPGVFAAGDLARAMPAAIFAAAAGASAGIGCDMDLAGLLP